MQHRFHRALRRLLLCGAVLSLAACGTAVQEPLVVEHVTERLTPYHPPLPSRVVTPENIDVMVITREITEEWNARGDVYAYYAFSEADYLAFAQWLQDLLRYTKQQREIIEYYRKDREVDPPDKKENDTEKSP